MRTRVIAALIGSMFFTTTLAAQGGGGVVTDAEVRVPEKSPFTNSWFWGLKGGWMSLSTDVGTVETESTVGIDWLITRTRGGLYLSFDQAGFDRQSSIEDPTAAGGRRTVNISNLRRFGAAAVVHPRTFGIFRPYAGIGVSLQVIGKATPVPDTPTDPVSASTTSAADDARSRAALLFMGGVQAQTGKVALFIQGSANPATDKSYLNNKATTFIELGMRYNFGSAIEKLY